MKRGFIKKSTALLTAALLSVAVTACSSTGDESDLFMTYGYVSEDGEEEKEIVISNEYLELHLDPLTTAFYLKDKNRGTEWHSIPDDLFEDETTTAINKRRMQSPITLSYSNNAGNITQYDCYEYSVAKGLYEINVLESNKIEINYSIGNIQRIYYIPTAVPESRMNEFLEQMDTAQQRRISEYYRKYDINKLTSRDDKNELLSKYSPIIEEEPIYELRDTVQPFLKANIEEMFESVGYTIEDYEADMEIFNISTVKKEPVFNITVIYELVDDSFVVSVPYDRIEYISDYPLYELNILPYFGAAGLDDEGYMLVPDGSGALINFNNGKENQIAYTNSVYGWDEGLYREAIVSDNRANFPVFGMLRNDNTMMCIIEEGASYANIKADVSGRGSNYNNIYAQYSMIHNAKADISGKSDTTILVFEKSLPDEQITQRYVFCDEQGYVGMAKAYREYLMNKYPELIKQTDSKIPVAVEIVGAVNKTQHILGIPVDRPLKLTSFSEAEDMINQISSLGFEDVNYRLTGWFNGSVQHSVPSSINVISKLGGAGGLKNLASAVEANNSRLYLEANFLYMTETNVFDGFSLNSDAARYVSRERVESYPYSFIWFGERNRWGKLSYLSKPDYMMGLIDNYVKTINKWGINNVAFRTIGANLAADYDEKRPTSREAAMNLQVEKLKELTANGTGIMINDGFDYTLPYVDFIVDMPLSDQGFGILDTEVPFYQIALHGLVSYAGRPINSSEDYELNLLNSVETGAGLFYSFISEDVSVLQDTKFHTYYGSNFNKWINTAAETYDAFKTDFGHTYNQFITNHTILSGGVTITEYEDGTQVLVNKADFDYNYNGTIIKARDYKVLGRGQ